MCRAVSLRKKEPVGLTGQALNANPVYPVDGKVNLDSSGKGSIAVAGVGSMKFAAYIALSEVKNIRDLDA